MATGALSRDQNTDPLCVRAHWFPRLFPLITICGPPLLNSAKFTHVAQRPIYFRAWHAFQRWYFRFLHRPMLSNYSLNPKSPSISSNYMLLEYIRPEEGEMLSKTWDQYRHDSGRKYRLFHGIARIMLSLAKIPQPRIGSFHFNTTDYTVTLCNRPLMDVTATLESNADYTMPRQTYQSTESFVGDVLTLFDAHFFSNEHTVRNRFDVEERLAIKFLLRATSHHFILREFRNGPFILQPTNLNHSDIFVDKDWNIKCLVDLEWICALPREMISVPGWLYLDDTGTIEDMGTEFTYARECFTSVMHIESRSVRMGHDLRIRETMQEMWSTKGFWFWACLKTTGAWEFHFEDHILQKFMPDQESIWLLRGLSAFWNEDIEDVLEAKIQDGRKYQKELKELFDMPDSELQARFNVSARQVTY